MSGRVAETTPITRDVPERFVAHERLQRGLLGRGARYAGAFDTPSWRTGLVLLLRRGGRGRPHRMWIALPYSGVEPLPVAARSSLPADAVVALAVDALEAFPHPGGAAAAAARLEADLELPVVLHAPGGVAAGPRAEAAGALLELREALALPEAALAKADPERAFAAGRARAEVGDFLARLRASAPRLVVTPTLLALCVLAWLLQSALSGPAGSPLLTHGAGRGALSLGAEPWRLLTAGFLHGGLLHLTLNMVVLWDLGSVAERLFGRLAFAAVYLLALVGGSLASAAWAPQAWSVGASGAVFGVAGALIGFVVVQRGVIPRAVFERLGRTLALFVVANLVLGVLLGLAFPIDNAAHVGGLVTGGLAGVLLARRLPPAPASRRRLLAIPALALVLAGVGLGLAHTPRVAEARAIAALEPALHRQQQLADRADALRERAAAPAEARALAAEARAEAARLDQEREARGAAVRDPLRRSLLALADYLEAVAAHDPAAAERGIEAWFAANAELDAALDQRGGS